MPKLQPVTGLVYLLLLIATHTNAAESLNLVISRVLELSSGLLQVHSTGEKKISFALQQLTLLDCAEGKMHQCTFCHAERQNYNQQCI